MPRRKAKILLAAGAGVALALTIPAIAQDKPESILPPGFGDPATPPPPPVNAPTLPQPTRPAPAPSGAAEGGAVQESSTLAPGDEPVEMEQPKQVELPAAARHDPRTAGVLSPVALGLGAQPFGAAHGKALQTLLRRNQAPLASRWVHIGVRNALIAAAPAPGGINPYDWGAERVWMLLRMGEADAARLLLSQLDNDEATPKLKQMAIQTALATGDPSAMCPYRDGVEKVEPNVASLIQAMCASLYGEPERAAADIQNARRRGKLSGIDIALADKVVGAGAETARAVTIEWEPVQQLNSWRFGLATATGLLPPERLINDASPTMRSWLARSPIFSAEQRIASARIAAALGVFSSEALVDLYSAAYDATDPDTLGSTDYWQLRLAYVGEDQDARMDAMRQLWGKGEGLTDRWANRVLLSRAARRLTPSSDLGPDADRILESLFAGGFDREAARWIPALEDMDDKDRMQAWGLLAVGAPDPRALGITEGKVGDFEDEDGSEQQRATAVLVAGLAGLGRIDAEAATSLSRSYSLGLGNQTGWSRLIDDAAKRGQSGTVLLLVASAFQGGDLAAVKPFYLYHSVKALKATGQDYLARMIATEAVARA
ncbi:hypothetical protein [Sphingomonas jaspsi]|uniref:hypothetical protein n=1 Tax=Sphingomonas jaspsi TaxID=392409 RepID=UPI0004BB74DC|nr:hypothetical protein [Sphingomonas jaspsi]